MYEFDKNLFTRNPNEHLQEEDIWFQRLDHAAKMKDACQIRYECVWCQRGDITCAIVCGKGISGSVIGCDITHLRYMRECEGHWVDGASSGMGHDERSDAW